MASKIFFGVSLTVILLLFASGIYYFRSDSTEDTVGVCIHYANGSNICGHVNASIVCQKEWVKYETERHRNGEWNKAGAKCDKYID